MVLKNFHESFEHLHIGTELPRSYFVPAKKDDDFSVYEWEKSSSVQLLNGVWDIIF